MVCFLCDKKFVLKATGGDKEDVVTKNKPYVCRNVDECRCRICACEACFISAVNDPTAAAPPKQKRVQRVLN